MQDILKFEENVSVGGIQYSTTLLKNTYAYYSQARFQQKQLQEKELKLLQLYDQQQQRAYQVAQRGSAGSNNSSRGSTISQQITTTISSSSHATSNPYGGKVRQMFDERRQTTVKGIDRSNPLEPLDNKSRKQVDCNGTEAQRESNNVTISRRSDIVRRIEHENMNNDVSNSNTPVVSYHEEITHKSFGSQIHRQDHEDDGDLRNVNRITLYSNGNHSETTDKARKDKIIDQDIIGTNRLMAKVHLMGFDQNLKHRIKNDLENEQFPEDLMIHVPDKTPQKAFNKKLSQAEARLQRFKNVNAKRNNTSKNGNSSNITTKKQLEPMFPMKPTTRLTKSTIMDPVGGKTVNANTRVATRKKISSTPSRSPETTARTSPEAKTPEIRPIRKKTTTKSTELVDAGRSPIHLAHNGANENGTLAGEHLGKKTNEISSSLKDMNKEFVIELGKTAPSEKSFIEVEKAHSQRQSIEKEHSSRITPSSNSPTLGSTIKETKKKMSSKAKITNHPSSKGGTPLKSGPNPCPPDLAACKICGRNFAQDRIQLHQEICTKTMQKKRKQFDATMHRVKGTELEPFVKKGLGKKQSEFQSKTKKPDVKSNWRKKHEDFINAIRSAKQVQAHLAAGGKLSDLPPPPASDTSDYIQCPHCGRKFNQAAAERHIPKCEHMLHNKPKQPTKSKH